MYRNSKLYSSWLGLIIVVLSVGAIRPAFSEPLRVLIVGGGPNKANNQVAIESNVRYVGSLLPPQTTRRTLFADGNPQRATVLYEEEDQSFSPAQQVFEILMHSSDEGVDDATLYKKPNLGSKLDGAAKRSEITKAMAQLNAEPNPTKTDPLLLYFTGHGSSNDRDKDNNRFDLWDESNPNEAISVRELAGQIGRLPAETPVTVVMVQCFSGAFANLIFEGGDPQGEVVKRDIAGFFAAIKERMAAGCTSAVNEAEYHDFTSYFFAALTGRDRLGRRVSGADYNADGRVGMDEAFCYTLAHDASIDVPVCTSDIFLRRFVKTPDTEVFATPYSLVQNWATPAQKFALNTLSQKLQLTGEGRVDAAYRNMADNPVVSAMVRGMQGQRNQRLLDRFTTLQKQGRQTLWQRWPALRRPGSTGYGTAKRRALNVLSQQIEAGQWKSLMDAHKTLTQAIINMEAKEVTESYLMRFVRLCKSVVLAHHLRTTGNPETKARFEKLIESEGRSLLPPVNPT